MQDSLRTRVAHHEAAHAVCAAAEHFSLTHTFLTSDVTTDATIGGCTDWSAKPIVIAPSKEEVAQAVARVSYAGQCAERYLAANGRVLVPVYDPNWDKDERDAADAIADVLKGDAHADRRARRDAAAFVGRHWRAIHAVALHLFEPPASTNPTKCKDVLLEPGSRVVNGREVRHYFGESLIAEGAFLKAASDARNGVETSRLDHWLAAQQDVGAAYPEILMGWILDDHAAGGGSILATFGFASSARAQASQVALANYSFLCRTAVTTTDLEVTFSSEGVVMQIASVALAHGGVYRRRHCAVELA